MEWRDKIHYFDCPEVDADSIVQLNRAISYIEDNLPGEINYGELAKCASLSLHHFQRLFVFIAGISVSEYIRRRRLTLAAFDLQNRKKVIDTAIKYGYNSPTSFCRAFKSVHGINPSAAGSKSAPLKAYPKMIFKISIKGDCEMNYRLEKMKAFDVFGVKTEIKTLEAESAVTEFWEKSRLNGSINRIKEAAGVMPETPVHAVIYQCTDEQYTYLLCLPVPEQGCPESFERITIPVSEWAVFTTPEQGYMEMSLTAADMWKRIFTQWFPMSPWELAAAPEMEMHYLTGDDRYRAEIWIPIRKK